MSRDGDGVRQTWTISADLAVANESTGRSFSLEGVSLVADEDAIELSGRGTAAGPVHSGSIHADGVNRLRGDCHASSGTLTASADGHTAVLEYLPTTPDDGAVMVSVDDGPAALRNLFRPCPSATEDGAVE